MKKGTVLSKNQKITLTIDGMTAEGSGVGKYEGMAVFVPQTAEGDEIECTIVKTGKSFCFGKCEKLITPSPERIEPDCPIYKRCGGCVYRHMTYREEARIKQRKVEDAVKRIGGFDLKCEEMLAAADPDRYRNKAQLPCRADANGKLSLGFFAQRSHNVVDCVDCLLQPKEFAPIISAFKRFVDETKAEIYNESTNKGRVRHLYLRRSSLTGKIMVCIVVNGNGLHGEDVLVKMLREASGEIESIIINRNTEKTNVILGKKCRVVWGSEYLTERICGVDFRISPLSFLQVNIPQAERLYTRAAEYAALTGKETVLDLYCGAGTIGLTMAKNAGRLIGAEIVPEAVENAKENAALNGIENARFIEGDAAVAAETLKNEGIKPDVVIIDPPRKGCDAELIETIAQMSPDRVVYVSCDCATLARDMKIFAEKGYQPQKMTAVDMFPRTSHVETVVQLSREKADDYIKIDIDVEALQGNVGAIASYEDIKAYVLEHSGLKVSSLYIAQVKEKYGLKERVSYNKPKSENARQPKRPENKEKAIVEALKHYGYHI